MAGEADEWKRILLLRHWLKRQIVINDDHPTPVQLGDQHRTIHIVPGGAIVGAADV